MSVRITGMDAALGRLNRLAEVAPEAAREVIVDHLEAGADRARALTPVGETGHLLDSWVVEALPGGGRLENTAPYAPYVLDFGAADVVDVDAIRADIVRRLEAK